MSAVTRHPNSTSGNVTAFPARPNSYPRRSLAPIPGNMTCLVLIKHMATEKALKLSDNGDASKAAWCPKSMLIIDPTDRGIFIVATLPKFVAEQNNLHPRWIDCEAQGFTPEQITQLEEAKCLAAKRRNQFRNHREPLPYPGRNAFA